MVDRQLRAREISNERVLRAMEEVPRECFLPEELRGDAYRDGALPIGEGQTMSQPWIVACMTMLAEPTRALAILSGDLRRIVLSHPEIAVKMLEGLADRLRAANERISRQSFQTVAGRVASALLSQVQARADGDEEREVVIEATQAEIAQLAGASRESASRFLAELERAGVVTCGRGKVVVHDPGSLRNYIY